MRYRLMVDFESDSGLREDVDPMDLAQALGNILMVGVGDEMTVHNLELFEVTRVRPGGSGGVNHTTPPV